VLSFILGLALALAAALAAAEMIAGFFGQSQLLVPIDDWDRALGATDWRDPVIILVSIGLILVGLLILATVFTPRRPFRLPLQSDSQHAAAIDRRGLQSRLERVATEDPEVRNAKVRIRRKATVRANVPTNANRRAVKQRLSQSIDASLKDVQLDKNLRSSIKVDADKARVR
jgi:MFS family permease